MKEKVLIFSAPSGSGKSTVVNYLTSQFDNFGFSISATSRAPRGTEKNGVEYYFYSEDEFRKKIASADFIEYEEVYPGKFYGTLKSEVSRLWEEGKVILFDVDVKGGINLKKYFGSKALSIFIQAPSIDVLRERLNARCTDTREAIDERIAKAEEEMRYADHFDRILVNDDLETCLAEAKSLITGFIGKDE